MANPFYFIKIQCAVNQILVFISCFPISTLLHKTNIPLYYHKIVQSLISFDQEVKEKAVCF